MPLVSRSRTLALVMLAVVTSAGAIAGRPRAPRLDISPDRLSYRLARVDRFYVTTMVVTLINRSDDTVYLATTCGLRHTPFREWEGLSNPDLFFLPAYPEACLLSREDDRGPLGTAIAIPPDGSRRDTIRVGARPFVSRGHWFPRQGVARYRVRYTPFVRVGTFRKRWTTDRHIWLSSDPFELITPGFER